MRIKSIFHQQVGTVIEKREIRTIDPRQLFTDMVSLCLYPFVAKPLEVAYEGLRERCYKEFIQERKKHVPDLLINSIEI